MLRKAAFAQNTQMRIYLATRNGLEPSTSSVTGWRANRLHHRAKTRRLDAHAPQRLAYINIRFPICQALF